MAVPPPFDSSDTLGHVLASISRELYHCLQCKTYLCQQIADLMEPSPASIQKNENVAKKCPSKKEVRRVNAPLINKIRNFVVKVHHKTTVVENLLTACLACPQLAPSVNTVGVATLIRKYQEETLPALQQIEAELEIRQPPEGTEQATPLLGIVHEVDYFLARIYECLTGATSPTALKDSPEKLPRVSALIEMKVQRLRETASRLNEVLRTHHFMYPVDTSSPLCSTCRGIQSRLSALLSHLASSDEEELCEGKTGCGDGTTASWMSPIPWDELHQDVCACGNIFALPLTSLNPFLSPQYASTALWLTDLADVTSSFGEELKRLSQKAIDASDRQIAIERWMQSALLELDTLEETYSNCLQSTQVWLNSEKQRRDEFEKELQGKLEHFQAELDAFIMKEVESRKEFLDVHGGHIPQHAFPEITTPPSTIAIRYESAS